MHDHNHDHNHDHDHSNDHAHSHAHDGEAIGSKDKLILGYTLDHSIQHTDELRALAGKLFSGGMTEAAELLNEAALVFEQGNEKLRAALLKL